jgi:hypothetical protein
MDIGAGAMVVGVGAELNWSDLPPKACATVDRRALSEVSRVNAY